MRFALLEGDRVEASPKLRATCPGCGAEVIAKCGKHVSWHWSHLSRELCDPWWETESEWHRNWKNRFPITWQEVRCQNTRTGEWHIADVKTPSGLVIEFQRSSIHPDEIQLREDFHRSLIWIVDGCKNDFDRFNFSNMLSRPNEDGIAHFNWFGRSTLFKRWHTTKPVFIDFGPEHGFWRVLRFDLSSKRGMAGIVNIDSFVQLACSGTTDFSSVGGPATE
ncbi:competence protein CoiA [Aliikangiella sp. G2MR2-5]|uniref:competence protein CoiA n=1 Tax=Aliikangiella sp. G2MR2-5 TaxID=2788943 RepID=UPI0018A9FB50|nr:competence protein CoiA family protein [Aliikangiella sp. G2MR2-5]